MSQVTMSIHQALAELKLLDKRINSATSAGKFATSVIGKDTVTGFKTVKEYEEYATSTYQSVTDLIKRRNAIKDAIVLSNATTKVRIGDVEMTVAAAIDRKTNIVYDQRLLQKLIQDYQQAIVAVDKENRSVQARLEELLKISLGTERKGKEEQAEAIAKSFNEDNQAKLVDPISIRKEIDRLQLEIDTFLTQVDYRLSESNTVTTITV